MISVPTIIKGVVDLMREKGSYENSGPYYDFGTHEYVNKTIQMKQQSTSPDNIVFPLVALILDIPEDKTDINIYAEIDFNVILAIGADPKSLNIDRETTSFVNVLYPLYEDFLSQMWQSNYFKFKNGYSGKDIPHTKTDMYFYNSTDGNNKWNRYVDAIQLQFRNIRLRKETC